MVSASILGACALSVYVSNFSRRYSNRGVVSLPGAFAFDISLRYQFCLLGVVVPHVFPGCCFVFWHLFSCNHSTGPPDGNQVDGLPPALSTTAASAGAIRCDSPGGCNPLRTGHRD